LFANFKIVFGVRYGTKGMCACDVFFEECGIVARCARRRNQVTAKCSAGRMTSPPDSYCSPMTS